MAQYRQARDQDFVFFKTASKNRLCLSLPKLASHNKFCETTGNTASGTRPAVRRKTDAYVTTSKVVRIASPSFCQLTGKWSAASIAAKVFQPVDQ